MRCLLVMVVLGGCAARGQLMISVAPPQPFCTRTLGVAECFADPSALLDRPAELADTPVRGHVACRRWWQDGGLPCLLDQPGRP